MIRKLSTVKRSFGQALREYRLKAGLSQRALAARAGISSSLVALLESGKRTPRRDKVMALSKALGLLARDRDRLFVSAGHTPNIAGDLDRVTFASPAVSSLEELLNDSRLSAKDKVIAETLLQTFAKWLRSELVAGRLNLRTLEPKPRAKR